MELRRWLRVRAVIALTATVEFLAIAFGVSILLQAAPAAAAQSVPYRINFQGRLTDNSGNVLSDGLYNAKFRLWTASSGGTNQWEADRVMGAADHRIQITNGLFDIQFGDTSQGDPAISPGLFNTGAGTLYLEVELPTPATATCATNGCASFTEGAMTPRQPLASSPYAINSDTLDGLDSSDFAQLGAANTYSAANLFAPTAAGIVALTVKATTAGGTDSLEVFDSSGSKQAYFDSTGALNLGLTLQSTSNNAIDLGTSSTAFRTGYFGTSIVTAALNATAAAGTITTNAGTLQRTAAGIFALDLNDTADTTLSVTNSGTGAANLSVEGNATIGTGKTYNVGTATGQSSAVSCTSGQAVTTATFTGGILTTAPACSAIIASGDANTTLSNLGTTSINADLLASADNTRSVGSASLVWKNIYAGNLDAGTTTTALAVGTAATTTGITIGRSGVAVSLPGGLTTSNGSIDTGSGTITSTGVISGGSFKIGSNDINAGGSSPTLSNVNYLDAVQTISAAKTFSASTTFSNNSGAGAIFSGTAASTGAIIQFGSVAALSSGSTNGTFIGSNPAAYSGDFVNFQINNAAKLKVDNSGNLTLAGSITPSANNSTDIGSASFAFRNGYFATSLQGPSLDTISAGALTIGASQATITKVGTTANATLANVKLFTTLAEVSTTLRVGDGTDGFNFDKTTGPNYTGLARPTRRISASPEFPGAVLRGNGTSNTGTLTTAFDATNFHNYYNWTTSQGTNQTFDVAIRVPVPNDFSALTLSPQLCVTTWSDDLTNGTITAAFNDTANAAITLSSTSFTPSTPSTWGETCRTISGTPTISAGGFMTLRLTLQAASGKNTRLGEYRIDYLSKF